jgi:hypothetical protein
LLAGVILLQGRNGTHGLSSAKGVAACVPPSCCQGPPTDPGKISMREGLRPPTPPSPRKILPGNSGRFDGLRPRPRLPGLYDSGPPSIVSQP